MSAPEPFTSDALWSAPEVREQSQQVPGQLDVWDVLAEECGHESWTGDEGPVALLGRFPRRWKCDGCGIVREDGAEQ